MIYTKTHLRTSETFQRHESQNNSQIIIGAFIECCKILDASIFEAYMEEDDVFEEKNKYLFLAGLKSLFDSYKSIKYLSYDVYVQNGTCQSCVKGRQVKIFTVILAGREIFKDQFAFVIEDSSGVLKDIYQCRLFCKE